MIRKAKFFRLKRPANLHKRARLSAVVAGSVLLLTLGWQGLLGFGLKTALTTHGVYDIRYDSIHYESGDIAVEKLYGKYKRVEFSVDKIVATVAFHRFTPKVKKLSIERPALEFALPVPEEKSQAKENHPKTTPANTDPADTDGDNAAFLFDPQSLATEFRAMAATLPALAVKDGVAVIRFSSPSSPSALVEHVTIPFSLDYTPGTGALALRTGTITSSPPLFSAVAIGLTAETRVQDGNNKEIARGITIKGDISEGNGQYYAEFSLTHDEATATGSARLTLHPVSFMPQILQPEELFLPLKNRVSEVSGTVSATAFAQWEQKAAENGITITQLDSEGSVQIENLGARAGKISLGGVQARLSLGNLWPLQTAGLQTVTLAETIVNGLPLGDGKIIFALDGQQLDIREFSTGLAGGNIRLAPFQAHLGRPEESLDLLLEAKNIEAQKIFELAGVEGLYATGTLSGRIPLTCYPATRTVTLAKAVLKADAPGVIRYDPDHPPAYLSSLGPLKDALKQFHYDEMEMEITGALGERQDIAIRTHGKNPDFYAGRPVVINMHVEGAIESLLRQGIGRGMLPEGILPEGIVE